MISPSNEMRKGKDGMENELFEKAPVPKAYFSLALPVVMGMVVSLVYNMVDTYFIAQVGNTDLIAGVSLSAPVFTALMALGNIFGLGGSSVISRLFGKKNDEDGKRLSAFCFYGALLCGVAVAAVLLLLRGPVLGLLGAGEGTYPYAQQYYTYIVLGAPFIILSFVPTNLLRTEGFAKASMVGSILGSVVNMVLDPIFISALGLGAAGAAIATVLGYVVTDVFFVWYLLRKSRRLSVSPVGIRISGEELGSILAIGIPASVTNFMSTLSATLTNRYLLPYGSDAVAAMGIVVKVNLIATLVLVGFAFGPQPLFGYNYGAGNRERLKKAFGFAYGFECLLAVALAVLLSLAARPLVGIFVSDPALIEMGVPMLRILQAGMVFSAVVLVTTTVFQSAGKAWSALVLSVGRQGVIFVVVMVLLAKAMGYYGVLAAQPVADLLTAALALGLFYRGLWRELKN